MKYLSLVILLLVGCSSQVRTERGVLVSEDRGRTSPELTLEIVDDQARRQLGLMYRKSLAPEQGMLFIFPDEVPRTFWMKNTFIELDMVFMDSNYRVVSIVRRAKPLSEKPHRSVVPARYVLEVIGGSLERWGIDVGATLELASS